MQIIVVKTPKINAKRCFCQEWVGVVFDKVELHAPIDEQLYCSVDGWQRNQLPQIFFSVPVSHALEKLQEKNYEAANYFVDILSSTSNGNLTFGFDEVLVND